MNKNVAKNSNKYIWKICLLNTVILLVLISCKSPSDLVPDNYSLGVIADSTKSNTNARTTATIGIPKAPSKLCIYYGWPSLVNGSNGNVVKAINHFSQFDLIVLGDNIWKSTHGDNAKTKQIIVALVGKGKKVYGYIDVGLKTQNLTDLKLKEAINGWKAMGANGCFGDDFGTDYGVYRSRQNLFIDYAHSKGMGVFVNCWSVNDALGGTDCHLDSRDYYLLESFGYGWGAYRPLSETMETRAKLAYYYMKLRQIAIATIATTTPSGISAISNSSQPFLHSYFATIAWNFDAFGFTDQYYSASGANANKVFAYNYPLASYGTSFVQTDYVSKLSDILYLRSTNTNHLYITDKTGYTVKK